MTKPFIHDDFLLHGDVARDLYHRVAKDLPIIDYHCHLPKTLLYNLNPSDNYVFGTMIGNFNDSSLAGKVQLGSG